jgi:hypothetical protein
VMPQHSQARALRHTNTPQPQTVHQPRPTQQYAAPAPRASRERPLAKRHSYPAVTRPSLPQAASAATIACTLSGPSSKSPALQPPYGRKTLRAYETRTAQRLVSSQRDDQTRLRSARHGALRPIMQPLREAVVFAAAHSRGAVHRTRAAWLPADLSARRELCNHPRRGATRGLRGAGRQHSLVS